MESDEKDTEQTFELFCTFFIVNDILATEVTIISK